MKIKTSELTGAALDWLVAKCEGGVEQGVYGTPVLMESGLHLHYCDVLLSHPYSPSTDWAEGGTLVEREGIGIRQYGDFLESRWQADKWAFKFVDPMATGPTPLIAAMRCLCRAKLGDEAESPEGLLP